MSEPLITKYRPITFGECLGNKEAIQRLSESIKSDSHSHCYLLTGPSGIGKTTIARILGRELNATIEDLDAASNNSVDDTRGLVDRAGFRPLTGGKHLIIIDECHALSKQAWQPLLKITEQPPDYLYFAFCTTEKDKVIDTIKTRSYQVPLKKIPLKEIEDLLQFVVEHEGWTVENNVFQTIVQASDGSARRALSLLQAGHACASKGELLLVIENFDEENDPVAKLCSYLVRGGRHWKTISQYLDKLDEVDNPILHASRYMLKVIISSEEEQAREISKILHSFSHFNTYDRKTDFVCGITWYLFGNVIF